jgi:hypothetical protein
MTEAEPAGPAKDPLPAPLLWAVRLLYAEAVAVAGVAAYLAYKDVTATATDQATAIAVTLSTVAFAVALGGLAYALSRCRPWARGPVVAVQLLLLPIAYYLATSGWASIGVPIALVGLAVAGLLVTPSSTKALGVGPNRAD